MQITEQPSQQPPQFHIYRYKFEEKFITELYNFSKIHQYDDRINFKTAWEKWVEDNNELVEEETRRLINLNYEGVVKDKMFRSARYYFRKKPIEKKEQPIRRKYICVDNDLITAMDTHISDNIGNDNYKPSSAFLDFCKENIDILSEEISRLYAENLNSDDIKKKIKKTYKNRYFIKVNIA